jgi:ribonucleoside-diphosphate reductase alpha chain
VSAVEEKFFQAMYALEFLPNSPTLMNAGTAIGQLAACFVDGIEDSMEGIFRTAGRGAKIFKWGGGLGLSFSRLRPKGDVVLSTQGVASGPVSFMHVFNSSAAVVKQGGRRRAAMMGALSVHHPDILDFIRCKQEPGLECFNLSVAVSDEFMAALRDDRYYELVNPRTGKTVNRIKAAEVFDEIVRCAWATGEPGVLFIDRINAANPTPALGLIAVTNPCGETGLLAGESCILGSINLANMVSDGRIDWMKLERVARTAVRFLDDVVEVNRYPFADIEEISKGNRKIGLGVMGLADELVRLGIRYDSPEALETTDREMAFIDRISLEESCRLAEERGVFPNFERSVHAARGPRVRHAARLAVAPTGSISIIAGVSASIEPIFSVGLHRNILGSAEFFELHPIFEEIARREGFYSKELVEKVAASTSIQHIDEIPEHVRRLFRTAHDIAPEWHVRMQAAFQAHVDNSVSKTINMPRAATVDDVKNVFMLAYELGCKGTTVYRNDCRPRQPMSAGVSEKAKPRKPRSRGEVLPGRTYKLRTGCGNLFSTITTDEDGHPMEIFAKHGKAGVCSQAQCEAIGRLASLSLRSGVDPHEIQKQLAGITCHRPYGFGPDKVLSCADAIARALRRELERESKSDCDDKDDRDATKMGACPACGAALTREESCVRCDRCGFKECG